MITYPDAVRIDISFDGSFKKDDVMIRAVLRHDFAVRSKDISAYAEAPE